MTCHTHDQVPIHDVLVVKYGPGGEAAIATLGAMGLDVVAVERQPDQYPLPRMVTFDAEACRTIRGQARPS